MAYIVIPPDFIPYVSTIVNTVISFTPLFSYGSTVLSIRRNKSSQGFSIDICGTMLVASILRIFYYFNDPFEVTLLRQCFVMVFIQTILLKVALKYRSEDAIHFEEFHSNLEKLYNRFIDLNKDVIEGTLQQYNINDTYHDVEISTIAVGVFVLLLRLIKVNIGLIFAFAFELFRNILRLFDYHYLRPFQYWQWRQSITFWKFLLGFISVLTIIQLVFNGNEYLGIILGSMSFMIESSLPLPQILLFQRLKHVENFKIILLFSWLGGDVTKISYLFYGTDNVGFIFVFAAFFQMSLNFIITYLFFYYKFNPGHAVSNNGEFQMGYLPIAHTGGAGGSVSNEATRVSSDNSSAFSYQPSSMTSNTTTTSNGSAINSPMMSTEKFGSSSPTINGIPLGERRSVSRAPSLGLKGGLYALKSSTDLYKDSKDEDEEDGRDLADGIDITGIIPKLNNGSVDKVGDDADSDDSLNGGVEVVRSRAGTVHA